MGELIDVIRQRRLREVAVFAALEAVAGALIYGLDHDQAGFLLAGGIWLGTHGWDLLGEESRHRDPILRETVESGDD
jgi:hypothetical protein